MPIVFFYQKGKTVMDRANDNHRGEMAKLLEGWSSKVR